MSNLERAEVRVVETARVSAAACRPVRRLMDAAFAGDFSEDDWQHALGGWHAIAGPDQAIVGHASVVERRIRVGARDLRAGYVEAVAVSPAVQRTGIGTAVMRAIGEVIRARFDLGVLSTDAWAFYERLGWERWRGPTYVRAAADGQILHRRRGRWRDGAAVDAEGRGRPRRTDDVRPTIGRQLVTP